MSRVADIRQWAAILLPTTAHPQSGRMDLDRAVSLAEALDERLAARGYPASDARRAAGEPKARAGADYMGQLSEPQRAAFERVYRAYGLPKGKQQAAMAWGRLNPDPALAARILAAAQADGRDALERGAKYPSGVARKYLQGWLSARAWEDQPEPGAPDSHAGISERRLRVAELVSQRGGIIRLGGDQAALARIDAELAALGIDIAATLAPGGRREGGMRGIGQILGAG